LNIAGREFKLIQYDLVHLKWGSAVIINIKILGLNIGDTLFYCYIITSYA